MQVERIESELLYFLADLLKQEEIDLIVCSERKGTAVLRMLIQERPEPRLPWCWERVVSSASIDQFDWASFSGKRLLVFEELVHHGRSLADVVDQVRRHAAAGTEIVTAGFAVWQRCQSPPDHSYYASVDGYMYEEIRDQIIRMLQSYGSLLLDTEHVELTIRTDCGVGEFYGALARASDSGNTVSFLSASNKLNLTIDNPDVLDDEQLTAALPSGTRIDHVIRKCRVVEKDHQHFSVMPIFYPSVPHRVDRSWLDRLPDFVDRARIESASAKELFYVVGLLASVEILKGVVAAISDIIRTPLATVSCDRESFLHLSAVFPRLDVEGFWCYVQEAVHEGMSSRPRRSQSAVSPRNIPNEDLLRLSYCALRELLEAVDDDWDEDQVRGRAWSEVEAAARAHCGDSEAGAGAWATVPDRLIDSGLVVTKVEEVVGGGDSWAVRTFMPDSEIVTERLRNQILVRGRQWIPQI